VDVKADTILAALNDIDDDMLLDAEPGSRHKVTGIWKALAPLAACLVLILGISLNGNKENMDLSVQINGEPMQEPVMNIAVEREVDRHTMILSPKPVDIQFVFSAAGEIKVDVSCGILRVPGNIPDAQIQEGREKLSVTWRIPLQEMPAVMTVFTEEQTVKLQVSYDLQRDSWIITKENIT